MNPPSSHKPGFFRRFLSNNFINLQGLPLGVKILTVIGYLAVFGLLFFTLLVELASEYLPTVAYSISGKDNTVPLIVIAIAGLTFILGWAFLLTGGASARARVFLPVLALYAVQLFLVTGGKLLPLFFESLFFLAVLIIYGFTFRTRFWSDLPGLHFLGWLAAVSAVVFLSVGVSATNADVAFALAGNFSILVILTIGFWILLGFSIIDLGIKIGRWFSRFFRLRLPRPNLNALIVFILLIHPSLSALIFWLSKDAFWLLDGFSSAAISLAALGIWLFRRWSDRNGSTILTLSLATPVVMVGLSLAFEGHDFAELILRSTGIFPPTLLFVGLTTYNLLGMGVTFTGMDGRILPRRARILLYFGTLLLVLASMLFMSNTHSQGSGEITIDIQTLINNLFALSAFVLGIPYLIWLLWKHPETLAGSAEEFSAPTRWAWLGRLPGPLWLVLSVVSSCACICLSVAGILWLAKP